MYLQQVKMVGAEGFEPSTSWSRTRVPAFLLLSTVSYPLLQSTTYQNTVENHGTPNNAGVGTVLGTVLRRECERWTTAGC